MKKQWQVTYNGGLSRKEFYDFEAASKFAAAHGSKVEPITRTSGFQLRTIQRVNGKPVQVIPSVEASR